MIALRSMAKDRRHLSQPIMREYALSCFSDSRSANHLEKAVASLPDAPEVEKKNKGCEDAMFNISNALSIFPLLGLLMVIRKRAERGFVPHKLGFPSEVISAH